MLYFWFIPLTLIALLLVFFFYKTVTHTTETNEFEDRDSSNRDDQKMNR